MAAHPNLRLVRSRDWSYLAGLAKVSPAFVESQSPIFFEIVGAGGARFGGFILRENPWGVDFHVELAPEVRGPVGLGMALQVLGWVPKEIRITSLIEWRNRPAKMFAGALGFGPVASDVEKRFVWYARRDGSNEQ